MKYNASEIQRGGVFMKPEYTRCTSIWPVGTVTDVLTKRQLNRIPDTWLKHKRYLSTEDENGWEQSFEEDNSKVDRLETSSVWIFMAIIFLVFVNVTFIFHLLQFTWNIMHFFWTWFQVGVCLCVIDRLFPAWLLH